MAWASTELVCYLCRDEYVVLHDEEDMDLRKICPTCSATLAAESRGVACAS